MYMKNAIVREDLEKIYISDVSSWEMLAEKSVLITGATGMLPSYLVFFFLYLNEEKNIPINIFALIRNERKAKTFFGDYISCDYFHLVFGDLCKKFVFNENVDYIIHGASLASPDYFNTKPVETLLPNVLGTYQLLEYSRHHQQTKFLFMSSGAIYGNQIGETPVSEKDYGWIDPLSVRACYSESKRMGETMCLAWFREYQVPTRIVRIRHTYGPTLNLENDVRSFSYFINCLLKGNDIVLNSNGSEKIEFLYLSDAITGILKVLLYGQDGQAYNLSNSSERIAVSELAELILSFDPEKNGQVIKSSDASTVSGKIRRTDTSKLEELGWVPRVSIMSGFSRTVKALKKLTENLTD